MLQTPPDSETMYDALVRKDPSCEGICLLEFITDREVL